MKDSLGNEINGNAIRVGDLVTYPGLAGICRVTEIKPLYETFDCIDAERLHTNCEMKKAYLVPKVIELKKALPIECKDFHGLAINIGDTVTLCLGGKDLYIVKNIKEEGKFDCVGPIGWSGTTTHFNCHARSSYLIAKSVSPVAIPDKECKDADGNNLKVGDKVRYDKGIGTEYTITEICPEGKFNCFEPINQNTLTNCVAKSTRLVVKECKDAIGNTLKFGDKVRYIGCPKSDCTITKVYKQNNYFLFNCVANDSGRRFDNCDPKNASLIQAYAGIATNVKKLLCVDDYLDSGKKLLCVDDKIIVHKKDRYLDIATIHLLFPNSKEFGDPQEAENLPMVLYNYNGTYGFAPTKMVELLARWNVKPEKKSWFIHTDYLKTKLALGGTAIIYLLAKLCS